MTAEKRSAAARDAVTAYAKDRGIEINPSQFTILPVGFDKAIYPNTISPDAPNGNDPIMVKQRAENRRVVFKIIRVTAELTE